MMKLAGLSSFAVALLLASSTAFADVYVTMQDGRVSIVARDATLRQILTEWARVGQTKIVNVDKIPGGPISLELTEVPEQQALDVLLRSLAGYLAAPRPEVAANLSVFDRIIVMPTLASARPAVTSVAPPPPPVFQQPQMPQPADTGIDEPPQVVNPQGALGDQQPPGFTTAVGFVPPQNQPATMPTRFPGFALPAGVAVPGMMVQPPRQPVQAVPGGFVVPHTPGQEIALQPSQRRQGGPI